MTIDIEQDRAELLELLRRYSFERRQVTLSSGKVSDFYIDCKRTALLAKGHYLVGRLICDRIAKWSPRPIAVGGLTLGADPIASAVSLTSYLQGAPMQAFIVRKEPKGHGTGQWLEGRTTLADGALVAIVEDVITTGASTLRAVERAEQEGLKVAGVIALVDRLEGGREAVEAKGIKVEPLFTRLDFIPA